MGDRCIGTKIRKTEGERRVNLSLCAHFRNVEICVKLKKVILYVLSIMKFHLQISKLKFVSKFNTLKLYKNSQIIERVA